MKCGVVRTKAVGVVVPVHNEEELLGPALGAIECAFSEVMHRGIEGRTAIVLDGCSDNSATIARHWARSLARRKVPHQSVVVLPRRAACVGEARRLGAAALLRKWRRLSPRQHMVGHDGCRLAGPARVAGRTGGRTRVRRGRVDGARDRRGLVTL